MNSLMLQKRNLPAIFYQITMIIKDDLAKTMMENRSAFDSRWHLRAEMVRLIEVLNALLIRQRQRGRTPAADALRGFVIEEGEADGLVDELAAHWAGGTFGTQTRVSHRSNKPHEVYTLADSAVRQGAHLPLHHAAKAFQLTATEYDALLLALAAELDARFGRLFAYLNDHVGQTRPTLGLALQLGTLQGHEAAGSPIDMLDRPLIRDGLIELEGEGPLPGRALCLPHEMAQRLTADHPVEPRGSIVISPVEPALIDRLVLPGAIREAVAIWAAEVRQRPGAAPCLLLAGAKGSGRNTLARAAVSAAGRSLITMKPDPSKLEEHLRTARRDTCWYQAALLLEIADAKTTWADVWRSIEAVEHPLLVSLPPNAAEEAASAAPFDTALITIEEPDLMRRRLLWQRTLPPGVALEPEAVDTLASSFRFNPGRMAQVVRRAQSDLRLQPQGERRLTEKILHHAARNVGRSSMGELAQRLSCPYAPEDLIVPPRVQAELDLALAWVRQQAKVLGEWGFDRRAPFGYGLSALFSGPSGTGKTMAAQVLAKQLDVDLYRVDLSRVVSKYIGETEKNLGQLFDESHRSGAALFFDEADALFGKRSEVKDAHDRYANVEIGYLLQRMEEHDGIVILATNRKQDMDEAFTRRFDIMVHFPMPNEAHRLRIWQSMFSDSAEKDERIYFQVLARKFELSGGEIRNVVLAAAYLAADEGKPIGMVHLKRALMRELRKSGRIIDENEFS